MKPATPRSCGYRFPAEWHRHAATWMSWPRPGCQSFPGRYDECIRDYCGLLAAVARFEPVRLLVGGLDAHARGTIAREWDRLGVPPSRLAHIAFHDVPTNEPWCRDHGPAFVVRDGDGAVVDFGFNAWGGKYPPWDDDDRVPARVAELTGHRLFDAGRVVVEGGAIEVDGRGTLLTTLGCLDNPNRNPGLSRGDVADFLLDYYGQDRVLWLDPGDGLAGDDTDGHVDMLARFLDGRTLAVTEGLPGLLDQCRALLDPDGRPYRVLELPAPAPLEIDGQRCPATHLNFSFVNGGLLVPTYDGPGDADALARLRRHLPAREVVGVPCRDLIWGLGAVHCLTQQQPAVS